MAATLTERETLVARAFFKRYKPAGIPPDTWTEIAHESKISNGNIGRNAKFAFNSLMAKLGGGGDGSDADGNDSASAASNGTLTPTKKGAAGAAKPKGVTKPKSPGKGKKGKAAAASMLPEDEDAAVDEEKKLVKGEPDPDGAE